MKALVCVNVLAESSIPLYFKLPTTIPIHQREFDSAAKAIHDTIQATAANKLGMNWEIESMLAD